MLKLADDIGVNTVLKYQKNGILDIDFDVFNENFWNDERPLFVKEEKKVLDIMYTLLYLSSLTKETAALSASMTYSQQAPKLNEPLLKVMCHGPDYTAYSCSNESNECDISKDESNLKGTIFTYIQHSQCESFKKSDHWTYTHGVDDICDDINFDNDEDIEVHKKVLFIYL